MVKTVSWLVQQVLEEQLNRPQTKKGRDFVKPSIVKVLLDICQAPHWFGAAHQDHGQQLLVQLRTANPVLPPSIRHNYPWTNAEIHAAAEAQPALAPILYFLFEAYGTTMPVNLESFLKGEPQLWPEYTGQLVTIPKSQHLLPSQKIVMLRSLFLAARTLSLVPDQHTTPPAMEKLACGCLTDLADRASRDTHIFFTNQPETCNSSPEVAELLQQLVKLLAPIIAHGVTPNAMVCSYCQERSLAAATTFVTLLKHGDGDIPAAVADTFLADGKFLMWYCSCIDTMCSV